MVVVDCGTTHPLATREIAAQLKEKGVSFLDAPVSGMKARARAGTLTVMVGGDEQVLAKVSAVLGAFGNKIIYMGESGNGQLTKLVNQLLFNVNTAAFAEILPMAVKLGLDPQKVCEVARTGTGASFALEFFAPLILDDDFQPGYHLKNAYKDMASAFEISARERIPLPVTAAAAMTYQLALAQGSGDENKGAMIKVWENALGVKVRKKGDSGCKKKTVS
jgi:3-hydroxyisobutyrate dehydrogenase-like beta-hydroxyacid dehydrogenase